MPKTEAWWVCTKCGKRMVRAGKGGLDKKIREHRLICDELAGAYIKNLPIKKRES